MWTEASKLRTGDGSRALPTTLARARGEPRLDLVMVIRGDDARPRYHYLSEKDLHYDDFPIPGQTTDSPKVFSGLFQSMNDSYAGIDTKFSPRLNDLEGVLGIASTTCSDS